MTQNSSLIALINAIREAHQTGNNDEAARLFQVLYAVMRSHLWNAYRDILYTRFHTNDVSLRAEVIFQEILAEVESDIRTGKFTVPTGASDLEVRKRLIAWVSWKVAKRVVDHMKKWNRQPVHREADLQFSSLEDVADEVSTDAEDEKVLQDRVTCVLNKLRPRDEEILRTRFYSDLTPEVAEQRLMEKLALSESALEKAITRARGRFRKLWSAHLNTLETKPVPK